MTEFNDWELLAKTKAYKKLSESNLEAHRLFRHWGKQIFKTIEEVVTEQILHGLAGIEDISEVLTRYNHPKTKIFSLPHPEHFNPLNINWRYKNE